MAGLISSTLGIMDKSATHQNSCMFRKWGRVKSFTHHHNKVLIVKYPTCQASPFVSDVAFSNISTPVGNDAYESHNGDDASSF
jgi:hypothetical protein